MARKCLNLIDALKNVETYILVLTFPQETTQQGQSHTPVDFYNGLPGLGMMKGVLVLIKSYCQGINEKGGRWLIDIANNKHEPRKWGYKRSLQSPAQLTQLTHQRIFIV